MARWVFLAAMFILGQTANADSYDRARMDNELHDVNGEIAIADLHRGDAAWRRGDYQSAADAYGRAIKLKPRMQGAYIARGNALLRLGRFDDAIADYDKAEQIGEISTTLRCFARAAANKDLDKAEKDCADDASSFGHAARGFLRLRQGSEAAALEELTQAIQNSNRNAQALFLRGWILSHKGDPAGTADLEAAKKLDPYIEAVFARYGLPL